MEPPGSHKGSSGPSGIFRDCPVTSGAIMEFSGSMKVCSVLRSAAASSDRRQRPQIGGNDVRGSAATSEGRQRRQRVGSDVRGSTVTSEGRQ